MSGDEPEPFAGELGSGLKDGPQGVPIQHGVDGNSLKLHDKPLPSRGACRAPKTSLHNGGGFGVHRPKQGDPGSIVA